MPSVAERNREAFSKLDPVDEVVADIGALVAAYREAVASGEPAAVEKLAPLLEPFKNASDAMMRRARAAGDTLKFNRMQDAIDERDAAERAEQKRLEDEAAARIEARLAERKRAADEAAAALAPSGPKVSRR